jgi:hypothetical protein
LYPSFADGPPRRIALYAESCFAVSFTEAFGRILREERLREERLREERLREVMGRTFRVEAFGDVGV